MALGEASKAVPPENGLLRTDSSFGKRKTPAELRIEQLKRTRVSEANASSTRSSSFEAPKNSESRVPDVSLCTKPKFSFSRLKDLQAFQELDRVDKSTANLQTKPPRHVSNQDPSKLKFKNVAELSSRIQHHHSTAIDMSEAIRGLGVKKDAVASRSASAPAKVISAEIPKIPTLEFSRVPLDLSLKLSVRFLSSKPFHWCHRIAVRDRFEGLKQFIEAGLRNDSGSLEMQEAETGLFWKSLHCWVHPQLALSAEEISALTACARQKENPMLLQMQRDWEDSLYSLYYAFRDKLCDMFYFCAQQFIVLFIGGGFGGRARDSCAAYITRSTRRVRGLLQQQDIKFSMPLCKSDASAATIEELQELSEFEKLKPGQTRLVDSLAGVDNSVQSLLAVDGREHVHRLFDFLLNYRHLMGAMNTFPALYSPIPFQNASLKVPEVSSKQMQVAAEDAITMQKSYLLEIKGVLLPPWVVSTLCFAIEKLHEDENFEVSFSTEALSEGLNVAQRSDDAECKSSAYGQACDLGASAIKQLKCTKGVYTATL